MRARFGVVLSFDRGAVVGLRVQVQVGVRVVLRVGVPLGCLFRGWPLMMNRDGSAAVAASWGVPSCVSCLGKKNFVGGVNLCELYFDVIGAGRFSSPCYRLSTL